MPMGMTWSPHVNEASRRPPSCARWRPRHRPVPRAPAAPSGGARLTRREREVVALIAQGHGNREIAERLFITEKTAEHHVSNILGKLGFTSRVQAAAYAVEQGLATAPAALAVS